MRKLPAGLSALSLIATLLALAAPAAAAPPNDDWTSATELTFPSRLHVDTSDATTGEHEQDCPLVYQGVGLSLPTAAIWYRFEVPEGGATLRYTSPDLGYAPPVQLWHETTDLLGRTTLARTECNSWGESWLWTPGTNYIAVTQDLSEGFDLDIDLFREDDPVPSNDVPYRATEIESLPFEATQNTYRATADADAELCPQRYGATWFSYSPPVDQLVRMMVTDRTGNNVSIFAFEEGSQSAIACASNGWETPASITAVAALRAGRQILINIGGFGRPTFSMDVTPAIDTFADRRALLEDAPLGFDTTATSLEPGEPDTCGTGGSQWFEIAAGDGGTLRLSTDDSITLAVYAGSGLGDLTEASCTSSNEITIDPQPQVRFVQLRGAGDGEIELQGSGDLGTQVTDQSPFDTECGDHANAFYPNSEVEVSAAVDPNDPQHVVAAWQQDRHEDLGGARGIGVGYSVNGGDTWSTSFLRGLSSCAGGPYLRMTDPWVSIGGDGTAYAMTLAYNPTLGPIPNVSGNPHGSGGAFAHRSTDGGRTWEGPFIMSISPGVLFNDKNTLTADPNVPGRVYASWQQVVGASLIHVFSRSEDSGRTWLPPVPIPGGGTGDQIMVLDNGTLVHISDGLLNEQASTSRDGGITWSAPVTIGSCNSGEGPPMIRAGNCIPSVSTDGERVFVSWTNTDSVVVASSADEGATWNTYAIPACCRRRFMSAVAATRDGNVGVISFDLANLDYRRARLMFASSTDGGETFTERIVSKPFDIRRAPYSRFRGYFLGDYMALQASDSDFIAVYSAVPDGTELNVSNIYSQRLTP